MHDTNIATHSSPRLNPPHKPHQAVNGRAHPRRVANQKIPAAVGLLVLAAHAPAVLADSGLPAGQPAPGHTARHIIEQPVADDLLWRGHGLNQRMMEIVGGAVELQPFVTAQRQPVPDKNTHAERDERCDIAWPHLIELLLFGFLGILVGYGLDCDYRRHRRRDNQ